jgi:hypothetical protein
MMAGVSLHEDLIVGMSSGAVTSVSSVPRYAMLQIAPRIDLYVMADVNVWKSIAQRLKTVPPMAGKFALTTCVKLTAGSLSIPAGRTFGRVKLIVKRAAIRAVQMNSAKEMMHRFNGVHLVAIHLASSKEIVSSKM